MCDIVHFFRTYCLLLKLDKYNKDFTNMCLAIPGKILSVDDSIPELKMAKVDFSGIVKDICVQWVNVSIGDYVLAHAGMAISVVNAKEAEETLEDLKKLTIDC
jgi:hydrogenase expression/formation protein HypC